VNHEGRELLRPCLQSLHDHPYTLGTMEIVVLDNGSDDGSVDMVRSEFPDVIVLAERTRRGFGANQNRAIAASHGDVLFLLNPDTIVEAGTIDRLAGALNCERGVVAAGGPFFNRDGSPRQDRPFPPPTPRSMYAKAVGLQRIASGPAPPTGLFHSGWLSGGACAIDRRAFERVGGFDEAFFMYAEDADLFARLREAGFSFAWISEAPVTHPFPTETPAMSRRRATEVVRADSRYIRKHYGRVAELLYRSGIVLDSALRLLLLSVPGGSRVVLSHGMSVDYHRYVHRSRLQTAIRGKGGAGFAELAAEWNRDHPASAP
jgi:GT2 family glycosyltransferase